MAMLQQKNSLALFTLAAAPELRCVWGWC